MGCDPSQAAQLVGAHSRGQKHPALTRRGLSGESGLVWDSDQVGKQGAQLITPAQTRANLSTVRFTLPSGLDSSQGKGFGY